MIVVAKKQEKLLQSWSVKDFTFYYFDRLRSLGTEPPHFSGKELRGFFTRMRGFLDQSDLTNEEYKKFIDAVFNVFYKRINVTPNFGTICSTKVLFILRKNMNDNFELEKCDFEKLRKELYGLY